MLYPTEASYIPYSVGFKSYCDNLAFYRFFQHALSNKVTGSGPAQCNHWLDNATDDYEVYRLSL